MIKGLNYCTPLNLTYISLEQTSIFVIYLLENAYHIAWAFVYQTSNTKYNSRVIEIAADLYNYICCDSAVPVVEELQQEMLSIHVICNIEGNPSSGKSRACTPVHVCYARGESKNECTVYSLNVQSQYR